MSSVESAVFVKPKRDTSTGQFMDVKKDGTPFKGVRKEK